MARRLGAGLYVLGSVVGSGDRLRVEAILYEGKAPRRRTLVEGSTTDLFHLVDRVAAQLLSGLPGGPERRMERTAALTTRSLPALKAYLAGEHALRAGDYGPALEWYTRAVAEDTAFALAAYRLSVAADWEGRPELARAAAERAARLGDALSERDAMLLRAWKAVLAGRADDAERQYREVLSHYPTEVEAWYRLGEMLFHLGPNGGRPLDESAPIFRRVVELDRGNSEALVHLARLAALTRDTVGVDSLVRRVVELEPRGERTIEARALGAFVRGDREEQGRIAAEVREPARFSTRFELARTLAVYAGEVSAALEFTRPLVEPPFTLEERVRTRIFRGTLQASRGRWRDARAELLAAEWAGAPNVLLAYADWLTAPFLTGRDPEREEVRRLLLSLPASRSAEAITKPICATTWWES